MKNLEEKKRKKMKWKIMINIMNVKVLMVYKLYVVMMKMKKLKVDMLIYIKVVEHLLHF
jgi:hypothetical protein